MERVFISLLVLFIHCILSDRSVSRRAHEHERSSPPRAPCFLLLRITVELFFCWLMANFRFASRNGDNSSDAEIQNSSESIGDPSWCNRICSPTQPAGIPPPKAN